MHIEFSVCEMKCLVCKCEIREKDIFWTDDIMGIVCFDCAGSIITEFVANYEGETCQQL